jgi:hypothetical protein
MLKERVAKTVDTCMTCATWSAALAAAFIGATIKADESRLKQWPSLLAAVLLVRGSAWWTLPGTTILLAMLQFVRSNFGSARRWKTVQVLLDQYKEEVFGKNEALKDDPKHYHRVTIFKYAGWHFWFVCWPWSGWMIPIARSGFTRKTGISCFRASLDHPEKAEGIAGRAFSEMRIISVDGLPDLAKEQSNNDDIKRYAERTFANVGQVESKLPLSRSLMGIPLEVSGKPWGAVVLDSHHPAAISREKPVYDMLAKVLNEIL